MLTPIDPQLHEALQRQCHCITDLARQHGLEPVLTLVLRDPTDPRRTVVWTEETDLTLPAMVLRWSAAAVQRGRVRPRETDDTSHSSGGQCRPGERRDDHTADTASGEGR